jgi:hypothetical protein
MSLTRLLFRYPAQAISAKRQLNTPATAFPRQSKALYARPDELTRCDKVQGQRKSYINVS